MLAESDPVAVRMAAYASKQHGIVDMRELRAAGVPVSTIKHWARSGRLFRLYPGVYSVVPPSMLTEEARWLAAVRRCGPAAFLSHGPSGQLQGIVERRLRFALHVSLADRSQRRIPGIVVHRPSTLDPSDTTTRLSIPTTTPTRTVWDISTTSPHQQVRKAFERAERLDLLDRRRLAELADAHPNRKGSGFIRQLLSERPLPAADVRSWLEELLWETCTEHRLPLPATNVPLLGYTVDFLWESARFVIEADGGDHLERTQRDRDNLRDIRLQRAGYLVRRYSDRDMTRPREVTAEILGILRERSG